MGAREMVGHHLGLVSEHANVLIYRVTSSQLDLAIENAMAGWSLVCFAAQSKDCFLEENKRIKLSFFKT